MHSRFKKDRDSGKRAAGNFRRAKEYSLLDSNRSTGRPGRLQPARCHDEVKFDVTSLIILEHKQKKLFSVSSCSAEIAC